MLAQMCQDCKRKTSEKKNTMETLGEWQSLKTSITLYVEVGFDTCVMFR